jgi:hypothetical protein
MCAVGGAGSILSLDALCSPCPAGVFSASTGEAICMHLQEGLSGGPFANAQVRVSARERGTRRNGLGGLNDENYLVMAIQYSMVPVSRVILQAPEVRV